MIAQRPRRNHKSTEYIAITYLFSSSLFLYWSHINVFATPEKYHEILNLWDFTQTAPSIDNALSLQSILVSLWGQVKYCLWNLFFRILRAFWAHPLCSICWLLGCLTFTCICLSPWAMNPLMIRDPIWLTLEFSVPRSIWYLLGF